MASFFSGCAYRKVRPPSRFPDRYGLTILTDGWRSDLFKEMLDAGELPNIKEHLVDRGTLVENCMTTFPSTTGPAHLPYINGCMPGSNNCPGLRWIDRRNNVLRDYTSVEGLFLNSDFPKANFTIYEILGRERTACIFDFCNRGAKEYYTPPIKTAVLLSLSTPENMKAWKETIDQDAVDTLKRVFGKEETPPKYTFVWLPAVDHLAHVCGSTSGEVCERAHGIDSQIGQIMETLQKRGIYDKTVVSLVADHGLRDNDPDKSTRIRDILTGYGFKVLKDLTGNDTYHSLLRYNAARAVSGDNFALLYFAKKKRYRLLKYFDWASPVQYDELRDFPVEDKERIDLIKLLRNEAAIKLVMAKEKRDVCRVFSKEGESRIARDLGDLRYTVVNGLDPLGYTDNPESARLIDGTHHDKDEWFAATIGTDYPDAPFQISQLFDSDRCGDIVISSEPDKKSGRGHDIMTIGEIRNAGHGGLEKAEMMVPCVIAGPTIKQNFVLERARTVDLFPVYLEYFGLTKPYEGVLLNVFA
jgi:hypothetical protein